MEKQSQPLLMVLARTGTGRPPSVQMCSEEAVVCPGRGRSRTHRMRAGLLPGSPSQSEETCAFLLDQERVEVMRSPPARGRNIGARSILYGRRQK